MKALSLQFSVSQQHTLFVTPEIVADFPQIEADVACGKHKPTLMTWVPFLPIDATHMFWNSPNVLSKKDDLRRL